MLLENVGETCEFSKGIPKRSRRAPRRVYSFSIPDLEEVNRLARDPRRVDPTGLDSSKMLEE